MKRQEAKSHRSAVARKDLQERSVMAAALRRSALFAAQTKPEVLAESGNDQERSRMSGRECGRALSRASRS
jgi:hypothetical protein